MMKRILLSLTILCIGAVLFAQAPQGFKYQTVVRDAADEILDNQNVYFKISILQYSDVGTEVYTETFDRTTNDFGLVTFNIGEGDAVETGVFEDIDWGDGPYFVKVNVDIDGPGGTYGYEVTGTSELLSVPYALLSKTSEDAFSGDYNELKNLPTVAQTDTSYYVKFISADEDYIDFGTFEGFTNSSDWSIIERVMMPTGTSSISGYDFFRGKAWEDKEGDINISISSTQISVMCQQEGWKNINYSSTFSEDTWYDICLQYDASETTLSLYLDGTLVGQNTSVPPQDDSGNTNKLFWGGQDVDPSKTQGDLYLEKNIIFSSQYWLQRTLTEEEISNYDGYIEPEAALFFAAKINTSSVTDESGNGHDGTNGNSPEYSNEVIHLGSEQNEPLNISGVSTYGTITSNPVGLAAALYMNSNGEYEAADADNVATMPCVAMALESGTGNKKILLQGYITNESWAWTTIGGLIYVSPETGELTQTIPASSGQQVQIVGYATGSDIMYFTPNLMLIEIE
jgi:hypothetical protein